MKNLPQITAILKLIASCRLQFQMMSSVSEMLEAINKVNNNRKAMGEWKKSTKKEQMHEREKVEFQKYTGQGDIQMWTMLEVDGDGTIVGCCFL